MRVESTCGVNERQFVSQSTILQSRKKQCKVTYLSRKAERKDHTEEFLCKIS